MPDVFQQLKQKSGWGDLIDTVSGVFRDYFRKLWANPNKYLQEYNKYGDNRTFEKELAFLSKNKGKKISWDQYKASCFKGREDKFDRAKADLIRFGVGDESGLFVDKALAIFGASEVPTVEATPGTTSAPAGSGGEATGGETEAPEGSGGEATGGPVETEPGSGGEAIPPPTPEPPKPEDLNPSHQARWIIDMLQTGPKTTEEMMEEFGNNIDRYIVALKKKGFNIQREAIGTIPGTRRPNYRYSYQPHTSSIRDAAWLPGVISGEISRLKLLHRASILSPSVKNPLNED